MTRRKKKKQEKKKTDFLAWITMAEVVAAPVLDIVKNNRQSKGIY